MADTHDTIDGLLAEFRGYAAGMPASYHVTMSWADFRKMLGRFDAAHRREVRQNRSRRESAPWKYETVEAAMADFLAWCDERKSKAAPFRVCACSDCPANKRNKVGCFVNWLFTKGTSDGRSDDRNAAHVEPSRARTDEGAADARHPCGHDGLRA